MRRVSLMISLIVDERGMTVSTSTIAQDITQQKEAEDERSRLLKELQDALSNVKRLEELLSVCAALKRSAIVRGNGCRSKSISPNIPRLSFPTATVHSVRKVSTTKWKP